MAQLILNLKKLAEEAVDAEVKRRDLVAVVRCKNCKFYSPNLYLPNNGGGCTRCGGLEYLITADEYCSKGERKEKTDVE